MEKWQKILSKSIMDTGALSKRVKVNKKKINKVIKKYPMKINPYYLSLIRKKNDPIWKQCIPNAMEVELRAGEKDPLFCYWRLICAQGIVVSVQEKEK